MNTRMTHILTLATALLCAGPARAGKSTDPLESKARETIGKIAARVKGAHRADTTSNIAEAARLLDGLKGELEAFERAAPSGDASGRTAKDWQRMREQLIPSLKALLELEQAETLYQREVATLMQQCQRAESALLRRVEALGQTWTEQSAKDVVAEAEALESKIDPALARFKEWKERGERLREQVRRFDASGDMKVIEVNAEASADGIVESNRLLVKAAEDTCGRLSLGDKHPELAAAMLDLQALRKQTAQNVGELVSAYNRFEKSVRDLRRWHQQETEELRKALCDVVEDKTGRLLVAATAKAVAARIADNMRRHKDDILAAADSLIDQIDALRRRRGQSPEEIRRLERARKAIVATATSVRNVVENDPSYRGANNPAIRTRLEVGKAEHLNYQNQSSKCTAAEVVLPSQRRIDCVKVDGNVCTIIEIKPDTPKAQQDGREQAADYLAEVVKAWDGGRGAAEFDKHDRLKVFKQCTKDNGTALNLRPPKLEVYKFCPTPDQWAQGEWLEPKIIDNEAVMELIEGYR